MVEKVSEVSMSVAIKGELTPDDNALLKQIAKKKKQDKGGEMIPLVAMLPPGMQVPLTAPSAQGGGLQKTEKLTAKEVASASVCLAADPCQTRQGDSLRRQVAQAVAGQTTQGDGLRQQEALAVASQTTQGDGLRQQVALAVAGQMARTNRGKSAVSIQKGEVIGPSGNSATAGASGSGGQSATPVAINVATNMLADAPAKLHQSTTAQPSHAAALVNPVIVTTSAPVAEAGRQEKPLRIQEERDEARPLWQGAKQPENVVAKQGETAAHSRNSPATLEQLKTQAGLDSGVKSGNDGQTLEVNYQFQRWSGDHSVRVSVPTEARREGNVTLLPSDVRAADVLLRNMGQLTGLSPDLLRPQQERDEQQQQRRQQQQQDEDQE